MIVHINRIIIMLLAITMIACVGVPARARGNAYTELRSKLVHYARSMLGTSYVWGGTSPRGFDCSGLVQYSYEKVGVSYRAQRRNNLPPARRSV